MQDLRFYALLKSAVLFYFSVIPSLSYSTSITPADSKKFIIVIDAGHGGKDIGTSGQYLIEKDATLTLAIELGQKLTEINSNIEIKYTRDSDIFLPIYRRVSYANDNKADLFISIHCNAVKLQSPHGIETYVLGIQNNEENLEIVKRENQAILHEENFNEHYNGFDPNSPTGHIFLSAVQNKFMNEGILLAHQIQTQFSDQKIMRDRGVKQAGFVVLKKATMPAILLEVGFLSNNGDESKLVNNHTRNKIVSHISEGINTYVESIQPIEYQSVENTVTVFTKAKSASPSEVTSKQPEVTFDIVLASSAGSQLTSIHDSRIDQKTVKTHLEDGVYQYSIGPYHSLTEAINKQNELRQTDFKGAYVIKSKKENMTASHHSDVRIKYAGVN